MKITFGSNFFKSFKKMLSSELWYNRWYRFFRYDIARFIKNIWLFRKALYNHYWWDHHGTMMFLELGIKNMCDKTEKFGIEIAASRMKKVDKMRRVVQIIQNYNNGSYVELAESELGEIAYYPIEFEPVDDRPGYFTIHERGTAEEKEHRSKVYKRAREIEENEWNELFEILKGQDYNKFDDKKDFNEQFDGSGIKGWWD